MKAFKISETFVSAIKNQAISSENEIYGWLIGYEKEDIPNVLGIFECKSFNHQTLISAIPNAQEFQEISSLMPQGIGPIGIYHSHPFSSEVFHSHTDDKTLISLSNQFPNCISLVTNGKEINFYQMGKNSKTREIRPKYDEPKVLNHFILRFEDELEVKIEKQILKDESKGKNINIQIINYLRTYYERNWKHSQFIFNNNLIPKNEVISKYWKKNQDPFYIYFKITPSSSTNEKPEILIIKDKKDALNSNDFVFLKFNIKTELPIYLKQEDIQLEQLDDTIRTELLSNNILQKAYHCVIDFNQKEIIIPNDSFLEYFGFLIRVLYFTKSSYNEQNLSKKNKQLIYKLISQFNTFIGIALPQKYKYYFDKFLQDVQKFSNKFDWYDEINKQITILYNNLKLK